LRICIDARCRGKGGVRTYIRHLLSALFSADRRNEYLVISEPDGELFGDSGVDIVTVPPGGPVTWFAWSNTILPHLLERRGVRVYHTLKHVTAFRLRAKTVVTLHGAEMVCRFPRMYALHDLLYWRSVYAHALRSYDRIVTATRAERDYVLDRYGMHGGRFRVVPFGVDRGFSDTLPAARIASVRDRLDLPPHFILAVGNFHPIKNLEVLVSAFHFARPRLSTPCSLVLVAPPEGPSYGKILRKIRALRLVDSVRLVGNVGGDLPAVYQAADLFVLPSLYESFGLAVVEAMACSLPVLASDIRQLDDVVGDAARRFNPRDPRALADAMVEIWNSPPIRARMRAQSLAQAARFSWEACARETVEIYQELGAGSGIAESRHRLASGDPARNRT